MAKSGQEIVNDIEQFISNNGGSYSKWYVGITEEPKKRLEDGHNVEDGWIYRDAANSKVARKVEKYFLDEGTNGGSGGGDKDASTVYAYKKGSNTNP